MLFQRHVGEIIINLQRFLLQFLQNAALNKVGLLPFV